MFKKNKLPNHIKLNKLFYNNSNNNINYDEIFNYIFEYTCLYDEQLDKYDEKRFFNIYIDHNNKNIFVYSFDRLLCFILTKDKNKKPKIYGHKYIDNYDNINHIQSENFIYELIKNINKNFDNIIMIE